MTTKKRGLNKSLTALLAETMGLVEVELPVTADLSSSQIIQPARKVITAAPPLVAKMTPPAATEKPAPIEKQAVKKQQEEFCYLKVNKLNPGRFQPRRQISETELAELAASIQSQGVLQPIVVRKLTDQQYEIIAGERRWRASQLAGLTEVPVIIKNISDEAACAVGLIENIQRQALNPMEEAIGIDRLIKQFSLTHAEVAVVVGKARTAISNLLRLLNLHEDVKKLLEQGELDLGHAKVLLGLSGDQQNQAAKTVVAKKLSVRETEALVAEKLNNNGGISKIAVTAGRRSLDPDVKRLQRGLENNLGAKVRVLHSTKGSNGRLVIYYKNLEVLEGILERFT